MNIERYNKSFINKEYIKGRDEQTEYYILTAKYGNHYEGLTMAKYGAF
ncbi:hypothetical protein MOF13_09020 [Bacillus spizizenii]|nr:hypothetical protein [Bacillus spizizenii]MCY7882490.1 hypothetical protein [Bacillus spizizenii]MCY7889332.1 hypothetical protein [Bacillus spizizenii]MCY7935191.1 hypothetical protein [Bacillus spizizenii]MCY8113779.1 hypothetical protein [Bacillus spizizenii]